MSLSEQLTNKKNSLKPTDTIITLTNGRRYLERKGNLNRELEEKSYGFIVDTKPDNIPAKITKNIYLGSQDCCELNTLQECNIQHVLSIGIEAPCKYPNIDYKYIKCLDFPEVDIITLITNECIPFINDVVKNDQNLLVHCNAGVSRSSSVVLAYLILVCNMSYDDAYNLVKSKRNCIRPNDGFEKQLKLLIKS
ncbi:hypothetical protein ILUMI_02929 [Ignelater luminosus]|uniref:Dual specificity protein phosphatase n=1 Tax=Ignelater luminosus TaxID=2038154 RepID=A0A8K0GMP9_IGNLU|nr:hypothetical protein ILUMI_02929 [Ignelater luminosus]